jgi:hypothetical protein
MTAIAREKALATGISPQGSMPSTPFSCASGSGTMSASWTGPPEPSDPSQIMDLQMNMTFNQCYDGEITLNGSVSMSFNGPLSDPTSFTFSTSSLSYINLPYDTLTMSGFTMSITDLSYDIYGGLTGGTITVSGAITGTLDEQPVDESCESLRISYTSEVSGDTITISGRLRPSCLGGWINISTTNAIFSPAGSDCPTSGDINISSGGNTVRVVISGDSSITLYLNGVLLETYSSCTELEGLCT